MVIDIPKDVQLEEVEFDQWPAPWTPKPPASCEPAKIKRIVEMIRRSKRPVLYMGGGIVAAGAAAKLRALARKNSIPVAATLMGLGCMAPDDPLYLGMLGMHGARYCNLILAECDLLLALGVRFDDRATGKAEEFCQQAAIVHIDIDPAEINKIKATHLSITGDVGSALGDLVRLVEADQRPQWLARVAELRQKHPPGMPDPADLRQPQNLLRQISEMVGPEAIISTDVGQHQMWTAQVYPLRRPRQWLTSGGLGTMGFGMPAAIGAALANPGRRVVCISGDGSFLMNIQELATMAEHDLDVTTIIMQNNHLGLVLQQQELFYNQNIFASRFETRPDFAAIARGFGVRGLDLAKDPDPEATLRKTLAQRGPWVVSAPIHDTENVFPMVPPGAANREMIGEKNHA